MMSIQYNVQYDEKKSFHIDLLGYKMDYCFMMLHVEAGPICISTTLLANLEAAQGWCE